ncbi:hypothetical protein QBC44DRAFT_367667 [Cladorrhinum sp. PSN332]|nr:hypothetical protein QBC44DRAFT_367667 [Cladorrhinum sp. PSN332]
MDLDADKKFQPNPLYRMSERIDYEMLFRAHEFMEEYIKRSEEEREAEGEKRRAARKKKKMLAAKAKRQEEEAEAQKEKDKYKAGEGVGAGVGDRLQLVLRLRFPYPAEDARNSQAEQYRTQDLQNVYNYQSDHVDNYSALISPRDYFTQTNPPQHYFATGLDHAGLSPSTIKPEPESRRPGLRQTRRRVTHRTSTTHQARNTSERGNVAPIRERIVRAGQAIGSNTQYRRSHKYDHYAWAGQNDQYDWAQDNDQYDWINEGEDEGEQREEESNALKDLKTPLPASPILVAPIHQSNLPPVLRTLPPAGLHFLHCPPLPALLLQIVNAIGDLTPLLPVPFLLSVPRPSKQSLTVVAGLGRLLPAPQHNLRSPIDTDHDWVNHDAYAWAGKNDQYDWINKK